MCGGDKNGRYEDVGWNERNINMGTVKNVYWSVAKYSVRCDI